MRKLLTALCLTTLASCQREKPADVFEFICTEDGLCETRKNGEYVSMSITVRDKALGKKYFDRIVAGGTPREIVHHEVITK